MTSWAIRAAALVGLAGLALSPATAQTPTMPDGAVAATFVNGDGEENGSATLTPTPSGVLVSIEVEGLPPSQWVAFHVHQTASCDHATAHESAGSHFNPTEAEHGYLSSGGAHAGDMPNQWVDAEGVLRANVLNTAVTLDAEEAGLLGRSLMIHAAADDYQTQPSGGAGARLACAPIPGA